MFNNPSFNQIHSRQTVAKKANKSFKKEKKTLWGHFQNQEC